MAIEIVRATPDMTLELSRIMFDAFTKVSRDHGFEPDFLNIEVSNSVMGLMIQSPDFYGVAAQSTEAGSDGGKLLGSNFVLECDEVGGVGPITVHCEAQGQGIGRSLMQAIIDRGNERKMPLRLLQDSFNMVSLALYTRLGYVVRETLLMAELQAAPAADATIRLMTVDDLDACDALCKKVFGFSRRNELAHISLPMMSPLVREIGGKIVGYHVGGKFGHGAAEANEDALALLGQIGRLADTTLHECFVPMRNDDLHRGLLERGARAMRVMTYMSYGHYEEPRGVWLPSIVM